MKEAERFADLVIQVPVEEYGLLDVAKCAEVIELGYQMAKETLIGFEPK